MNERRSSTSEASNGGSKPAYQVVADALRYQILAGELEPNHRLPAEGELAERFGVSRSTVREALRTLSSQRLIVTTRGVSGGTFVVQPALSDVGDVLVESLEWLAVADQVTVGELLEARELLEVPAAGLAAQRRSPDELAELRATLDDDRLTESGFEARRSFHLQIVAASNNRLLQNMAGPVFVVLQNRFLRDRAPETFWERVDAEHRTIYEAIASGDPLAAEYEMREHLHHLRRLYEQIDRRRDA